jgi:hypothetical protein
VSGDHRFASEPAGRSSASTRPTRPGHPPHRSHCEHLILTRIHPHAENEQPAPPGRFIAEPRRSVDRQSADEAPRRAHWHAWRWLGEAPRGRRSRAAASAGSRAASPVRAAGGRARAGRARRSPLSASSSRAPCTRSLASSTVVVTISEKRRSLSANCLYTVCFKSPRNLTQVTTADTLLCSRARAGSMPRIGHEVIAKSLLVDDERTDEVDDGVVRSLVGEVALLLQGVRARLGVPLQVSRRSRRRPSASRPVLAGG